MSLRHTTKDENFIDAPSRSATGGGSRKRSSDGQHFGGGLCVGIAHVFNRLFDQLLQGGYINIFDLLDIQARLACFVLSQSVQELLILIKPRHNVKRQVLFSRGEAG